MAKKPKLHEILAVEKGVETAYDESVAEAQVTFKKKANLLRGFVKVYEPLNDEDQHEAGTVESQEMVTTVHDKVKFVFKHFTKYLDAVLQKERTNQDARADIELPDGTVLATDVPATFLLGLETKLKKLRVLLRDAPTLEPGLKWIKDSQRGENVYVTEEPEVRDRTKKVHCHKVMHPGSEHHPAQIAEWNEDQKIGKFLTTKWCGLLSPAEKSIVLGRLDDLERAVKKARQRANSTEVVKVQVGKKLTGFLLTGATA